MASKRRSDIESLAVSVPAQATAAEIFAANEAVVPAFVSALEGPAGAAARRDLLEKRKLPSWLVAEERLGFIPEGRTTVLDAGVRAGITPEVLAAAALCKRDDWAVRARFRDSHGREAATGEELAAFFVEQCLNDPGYYRDYYALETPEGDDLYGNWLAIPIRVTDIDGQVRVGGFQLRSAYPTPLIGRGGRYRNPIPTPAMAWNDTIIGLASECQVIAASDRVVIVEGYFDRLAIKAAVADLPPDVRPGVVALGGATARGAKGDATPEALLGVVNTIPGSRVTLFTDMDDAGLKAVLGHKSGERFVPGLGPALAGAGRVLRVARIPEVPGEVWVKDPGELLEHRGTSAVRAALDDAEGRDIVTFALGEVDRILAAMPDRGLLWHRLRAVDRLAPILGVLPPIVRETAYAAAAAAARIDPAVLRLGAEGPGGHRGRPGRTRPRRG